MNAFYKQFKLAHKLSFIVIMSILVSFVVLGFYFDSFLKEHDFQNTKKRMLHAYNRVALNMLNTQNTLKEGIRFVQADESIVASIELINNYQDKKNYNAVLLDEEKKYIADQLLSRVKISFNNDITLYDKNEELIAYVLKEGDVYVQYFIAYENAASVIYCKKESENLYTKEGCKEHELIKFNHASYYAKILPTMQPIITQHLFEKEIYIKSHYNIFSAQNSAVIGHIEMSNLYGRSYFETLSKELDIHIALSLDEKYALGATPLLESKLHDKVAVFQTDKEYFAAMNIDTQEKKVYVLVSLKKEILATKLTENRVKLFIILFILSVSFLMLLRFIFAKLLANPMEVLMEQIDKIEKRNYTQTKQLKSGDELECISKNINTLASTIQRREASLRESQENLEYISNHDLLTNLPNRRLFKNRLENALMRAEQNGQKAAIIFFDLDDFKEVNDSLGHDIGDLLLQEVAKRISEDLADAHTLARIGGDEFYVLLENIKQNEEIDAFVQKIVQDFKYPFLCNQHSIKTSASIGVSLYPDNGKESVTLIKNADLAMYASKKSGRNSVHFFSEALAAALNERMTRIEALRKAVLTCEEFFLMYQPKISAVSQKIVAVEALVRWKSATLGTVFPDKFIKLAEETKLIVPLGEWILQKACHDFVSLQEEGYILEHISINVSSVQLMHSDVLQTVQKTLQNTHVKATQVELEITESYIASDELKALRTLQAFRDMGILLAIDDFGTGYSSLSYLQKLPVTRLKIDKSFVDNLPDSADSVSIVKVIIALAKTFHLSVTAEGVETKEQLEFLQKEKCDEIQGYYYAKPLSLEDLKKFYKEQK